MAGRPALASLGMFWAAVLSIAGIGAVVLQVLGPPLAASPSNQSVPPPIAAEEPALPKPKAVAETVSVPPTRDPIAAPDPALLEEVPGEPGAFLPRIAADGRVPMKLYARPFDASDKRPRIGLLFVGFGMADSDSAAVDSLPGGVTLAFSPYGPPPLPLLAQARARGHEYLISIPMESRGYPLNDAGNHSLLTGADPRDNAKNLAWALSRIAGYVGVTGALGELRGERFADAAMAFGLVQSEVQSRGLLTVDPRPNAPTHQDTVVADIVVDDPATRLGIDNKLGQLEAVARDHGSALGLAGPLRQVSVDRVAAWARGLDARGFALAPVSALLPQPGRP